MTCQSNDEHSEPEIGKRKYSPFGSSIKEKALLEGHAEEAIISSFNSVHLLQPVEEFAEPPFL